MLRSWYCSRVSFHVFSPGAPPAIVHDHVLRRHRLPFNLRPVSRAYPAAATPPGFLSSVLLHRCIIRHPTDLCITRPPIPLHHPSSHTVASSASSASSRLNLASVGNPWHSASSSHRPWLSPSCRQAAAKLPPRASELSPWARRAQRHARAARWQALARGGRHGGRLLSRHLVARR